MTHTSLSHFAGNANAYNDNVNVASHRNAQNASAIRYIALVSPIDIVLLSVLGKFPTTTKKNNEIKQIWAEEKCSPDTKWAECRERIAAAVTASSLYAK